MASVRVGVRLVLLVALLSLLVQATAPIAAASGRTEYQQVYRTAHAQLGDQWKFRARGPNKFDCSGLVWFAFAKNGLRDRIGGYRSVAGYLKWFKSRGLVSHSDLQVGDLIVWGHNQHIGIYIGNGKAISTLVTKRGVAIHPVRGYLGIRVKAYLHTSLTRPTGA